MGRNPRLDPTPPGMKPMRPVMRPGTGAITSGDNAEQQLNAMAKQIATARNITFSQAYVEPMVGNPHLYRAYLEQHSHQTGGPRG